MSSMRDTIHEVYEKLGNLQKVYEFNVETKSDINEHLPTLKKLAEECEHVTEFGTRWCCSTSALLIANPKKLISYDVSKHPAIKVIEKFSRSAVLSEKLKFICPTEFVFHRASTLEVSIEETDLLFIDTWQVYDQLKEELKLHGNKVKKYIVMHDTETYKNHGDTLKGKLPNAGGLRAAINEFLAANPNWKEWKHYQNNNGLTVLKRMSFMPK